MKKLKYMISRLLEMDYKKFFHTVNLIHKETKKSRVAIMFELLNAAKKYGSGYTDYHSFAMYAMTEEERKTILTREKNNYYVMMYNPKEYWHIFDNKNEFNTLFDKYLKRSWIYIPDASLEEFITWVKPLDSFIAKPNNDSGGNGIEKIEKKNFNTDKEIYDYLIKKNITLLEELVVQHDELAAINPSSVNTIRLITILKNDKLHFVTAFLRVGGPNSFVDNSCSGGMHTMIDLNTGITMYPAIDLAINVFDNHPATNKALKGIKIPYFKEAKELVEELAIIQKNIKYTAWDIAITNDGPVVIEGNPYPGYYYQFPIHCPNKIGVLPIFEEIEKE